jgi:hypothetical protein
VARPPRAALTFPRVLAAATALAAATVSALPAHAGQALTAARAGEWWLTALDTPAAWRAAPQAGRGITVAVLSTGVDATHPDLSGAVVSGPDFSGTGRVAGGPYWGAEGTAVAGLIAGHGHGPGGADGITGVAPHARILSVQVTQEYDDPQDSDTALMRRLPDAIAAGIRYAVEHGATVIALPLDPGMLGHIAGARRAATGGSAAERAAVSFALAHDVLLVAPAGDNGAAGDAPDYPAAYPGVIATGATARDGRLSVFTSRRGYVMLAAPGSGLTPRSPQPFGPMADPAAGLPVAAPDGGYESLASTDMAAALSAGVAALIRSSYPRLTVPEITQALARGAALAHGGGAALAHGGGAGWGHGALSAAAALAAAKAIAAARPAAASSAPAQGPAPRRAASQPAAAGQAQGQQAPAADLGQTLQVLLIDVVIAAGALIVLFIAALSFIGLRGRAGAAARRARAGKSAGYAGTHARRARDDRRPGPDNQRNSPGPRSSRSASAPGSGLAQRPGTTGGAASGGTIGSPGSSSASFGRTTAGASMFGSRGAHAARPAPAASPSWSDSAWSTSSKPAWPETAETVAVPGWTALTAAGTHAADYQSAAAAAAADAAPPTHTALPPHTAHQAHTAPHSAAVPAPPWEQHPTREQPGANFIPAPLRQDASAWPPPKTGTSTSTGTGTGTGTGPMYIWNPAATTAPLRRLNEDQNK